LAWTIEFSKDAKKQLKKLPKEIQHRVDDLLYKKLKMHAHPRMLGEPLTGEFKGLWKYRVGKYRLIADILDDEIIILVLKIEKREKVYS